MELWLEILAYLPNGYLRKMMGISRVLFMMALSDIYQRAELRLGDQNILKTFGALR
jgi:hypothetical protein